MTMEVLLSIIQLAARVTAEGYEPERVWELYQQLKGDKQYRVRPGRHKLPNPKSRRRPPARWFCIECGVDIRDHLCPECGADNTYALYLGINRKRRNNDR